MSQTTRIVIGVVALVLIAGLILGIDALQRRSSTTPGVDALAPGSIPIHLNGDLVGGFMAQDLDSLDQASFVDAEEGKTQEGWLLGDVLAHKTESGQFSSSTRITVSSSSRGKEAQLTWAEVKELANMVMFDLSGRGTLKLISLLERLDVRDEWIQDVDKIEIETEG